MSIKKSKHFFEEGLIETIGEVSENSYEPMPENKKLNVIGKKNPRYDGYDKVSGKAIYTFDISLKNMAYARILRSSKPNAKIKSIDLSKAMKMDGVLDIITYNDVSNIEWYGGNSKLLDRHVRYEGDEIAFVSAETEKIALEAIKNIRIEYEELGFSTNSEESLRENAYQNYEWGNIIDGKPSEYERGNVEEGFKESDFIVEDVFSTQVVIHNPTEVHCSAVEWKNGKLTVWDSTQGVFSVRKGIAGALNIDQEDVRVIKKYMGGGFGSKLETGKYTVLAALSSKKLKRPVKVVLDRREMNLAVGNRPDSIQKLKVGVKSDGLLIAMSHESQASVGAYPSGGQCSWPLKTMYKCPNVKTADYSLITNTGKARPFRAPGHVQGVFGLDSIIDMAAEKVGMDPLEFRLLNYAEKDQVWGAEYTSKLLREAYHAGAENIGWHRRNKIAGSGEGYIKTGMGMASQIWWGGGGPPAHAKIEITKNGKITVYSGTQDLGTGTYTIIAQVAAEVLDVDFNMISVVIGDTDLTPYGPSSGGSVTAASITPAVRDAAEKMRGKIISASATILDEKEQNIVFSNGRLVAKNKSKEIMLNELIESLDTKKLTTDGAREENLEGFITQSFGAQFAEVSVDTLTGVVKVNKVVAAHDIGRTLNKQTLENQFHGGIMQGIGFALMEERILDNNSGRVLNPNMHEYKIPTILDMPNIEVIIVSEKDDKANNMGVKGIGEPAIIPTAGAIANAVYNAIGVRIKSLPITPDKVINALNV